MEREVYEEALKKHNEALVQSERLKSTQFEANESLNEVKKAIAAGESITGNPLEDFLIFAHGFEANNYRDRYIDLQDRLKGKAGELVLRVDRTKEKWVHREFGSSDNDYFIAEALNLGLLDSESLLFEYTENKDENQRLSRIKAQGYSWLKPVYFDTGAFVFHNSRGTGTTNLHLSADLTYIETETPNILFHSKPDMQTEILVGNGEVNNWFKTHRKNRIQESLIATLNSRQLI